MTTIQTTGLPAPTEAPSPDIPAAPATAAPVDPWAGDSFTSAGTTYDTLAAVATRLAVLAVEDTLNGPAEERAVERVTLVEHLMRFANAHGSTRPAAALRKALAGMQFAVGRPGTPVLSVVEEIHLATAQTR
jgi:hypothetical protein